MATFYLRHPLHGEKVCHSESEASSDKANGWVGFAPTPPPAPVEVVEVIPEPVKAAKPKPVKAEPVAVPDFFNVINKP